MHFLYVLFQFMWYKQITLIDPDDHSEWRTTLNPVCQMYIHNSAGYASAEFDNTTYASFIKNCLVPYVTRMATCASQVPHIDCSIVYSWRSLRQKLTSSTANLEGCPFHLRSIDRIYPSRKMTKQKCHWIIFHATFDFKSTPNQGLKTIYIRFVTTLPMARRN